MNQSQKNAIAGFACVIALITLSISFTQDVVPRHDEGVLDSGWVVDVNSTVVKRNHSPIAIMGDRKKRVSTWKVSYVDATGKIGRCHYFTLPGERVEYDEFIKCRYKSELEFD